MAKPLSALTCHDVKFTWTSSHLTAFNTLKSALLEAPILTYLDPSKHYIVYVDALDGAFGAQLPQEHDGLELTVAFLLHIFTDTKQKWSTMEQEAYGIYYAVTNSPIVCVVLALDSWNSYSGEQAQQPKICKIVQSLYSWTMYILIKK